MEENTFDLTALSEKPLESWTLAECKEYCKAASYADLCETADCLLCSFCLGNLKIGPLDWWNEDN